MARVLATLSIILLVLNFPPKPQSPPLFYLTLPHHHDANANTSSRDHVSGTVGFEGHSNDIKHVSDTQMVSSQNNSGLLMMSLCRSLLSSLMTTDNDVGLKRSRIAIRLPCSSEAPKRDQEETLSTAKSLALPQRMLPSFAEMTHTTLSTNALISTKLSPLVKARQPVTHQSAQAKERFLEMQLPSYGVINEIDSWHVSDNAATSLRPRRRRHRKKIYQQLQRSRPPSRFPTKRPTFMSLTPSSVPTHLSAYPTAKTSSPSSSLLPSSVPSRSHPNSSSSPSSVPSHRSQSSSSLPSSLPSKQNSLIPSIKHTSKPTKPGMPTTTPIPSPAPSNSQSTTTIPTATTIPTLTVAPTSTLLPTQFSFPSASSHVTLKPGKTGEPSISSSPTRSSLPSIMFLYSSGPSVHPSSNPTYKTPNPSGELKKISSTAPTLPPTLKVSFTSTRSPALPKPPFPLSPSKFPTHPSSANRSNTSIIPSENSRTRSPSMVTTSSFPITVLLQLGRHPNEIGLTLQQINYNDFASNYTIRFQTLRNVVPGSFQKPDAQVVRNFTVPRSSNQLYQLIIYNQVGVGMGRTGYYQILLGGYPDSGSPTNASNNNNSDTKVSSNSSVVLFYGSGRFVSRSYTFLAMERSGLGTNIDGKNTSYTLQLVLTFGDTPGDVGWVVIQPSNHSRTGTRGLSSRNNSDIVDNVTIQAFGPTISFRPNLRFQTLTEQIQLRVPVKEEGTIYELLIYDSGSSPRGSASRFALYDTTISNANGGLLLCQGLIPRGGTFVSNFTIGITPRYASDSPSIAPTQSPSDTPSMVPSQTPSGSTTDKRTFLPASDSPSASPSSRPSSTPSSSDSTVSSSMTPSSSDSHQSSRPTIVPVTSPPTTMTLPTSNVKSAAARAIRLFKSGCCFQSLYSWIGVILLLW